MIGGYVGQKLGEIPSKLMAPLEEIGARHAKFGGEYRDSDATVTMRQRAVQEMGSSALNARRYLGSEAVLMHQYEGSNGNDSIHSSATQYHDGQPRRPGDGRRRPGIGFWRPGHSCPRPAKANGVAADQVQLVAVLQQKLNTLTASVNTYIATVKSLVASS